MPASSAPAAVPARLTARTADRHQLYERAVQAPADDAAMLDRLFRKAVGRPLRRLREDFCGTAAMAQAFVEIDPKNTALAVDLDAETLNWAKTRRLASASESVRSRLTLKLADVRDVSGPPAELLAAMNFSWQVFSRREALHGYFKNAARSVVPGGLVVADAWGGSETQLEGEERRRLPGFTYVWERRAFDPLTYRAEARIHFEFRDGTRIRDAFKYSWRLWPLPDVKEAFEAAGLVDVAILWEGTDRRTGGGNGSFRSVTRGEACRSYIAYVVGRRPV